MRKQTVMNLWAKDGPWAPRRLVALKYALHDNSREGLPTHWDWAPKTLPFAYPSPLIRGFAHGPPEMIVSVAESKRRRARMAIPVPIRPPPLALENRRASLSRSRSQPQDQNNEPQGKGQPEAPPSSLSEAPSSKDITGKGHKCMPSEGKTSLLTKPSASPRKGMEPKDKSTDPSSKVSSQKGKSANVKPFVNKSSSSEKKGDPLEKHLGYPVVNQPEVVHVTQGMDPSTDNGNTVPPSEDANLHVNQDTQPSPTVMNLQEMVPESSGAASSSAPDQSWRGYRRVRPTSTSDWKTWSSWKDWKK